jgi:hypothetical protein
MGGRGIDGASGAEWVLMSRAAAGPNIGAPSRVPLDNLTTRITHNACFAEYGRALSLTRRLIMRRIWVVLLAIFSMNTLLLSGCPIGPAPEQAEHGGSGGGGGY